MINAIKRFYNHHIQPQSGAVTSQEATDHALKMATAALLIEVTRADHEVKPAEQQAVLQAIRTQFSLSGQEATELVDLARQEVTEATSLYQFTHLIDKGFSAEQKRQVVALLWRVVFSDQELEKHEEHLVRRVAKLIHVPHKVFIDTKLQARDAARGD